MQNRVQLGFHVYHTVLLDYTQDLELFSQNVIGDLEGAYEPKSQF